MPCYKSLLNEMCVKLLQHAILIEVVACMPDRQKKEQTRRINFDRLQLINIGDCRMVQLSLMNTNWALISARMNRLIVT